MAQSTDDIFASLGGSLMKDLWEDLQIGEDDLNADGMGWSLEQLERELAHLEDGPQQEQPQTPTAPPPPPPGLSAASLVVSHAQEKLPSRTTGTTSSSAPLQTADAWSQSLEKFTASSLEKAFLEADSARKKPTTSSNVALTGAVDYDVSEPVALGPPPGLTKRPPGIPSPPSRKPIVQGATDLPPEAPRPVPLTPHNSFSVSAEETPIVETSTTQTQQQQPKPRPAPPTPHSSFSATDESEVQSAAASMHARQQGMLPMQGTPPTQQPVQPPMVQQQQPLPPVPVPPQQQQQQAWRAPPPPQRQERVYCQSHPSVPPIPAGALESSYMKARDITYVLHSMLKPVLLMGVSSSDYHVQLLARHQRGATGIQQQQKGQPANPTQAKSVKTKEWMEKHSTLGHVSKTDVSRPRALIATSTMVKDEPQGDEGGKQQQRATLWKSRLYIDQAYQAFEAIVDICKSAPPGKPPREIQPHLLKLYKYLGVSIQKQEVDRQALQLICKLHKGRTLLARVLERALLPPHVVQSVLPVAITVLLPVEDDDRTFRVSAHILASLPDLKTDTVMACIQAFLDNPKQALNSTPRMECVHALLRRASAMAAADAEFAKEWTQTEQEFLQMLGSMQ